MSDLVGNPEDRFSHNEAHLATERIATDVHSSGFERLDSAFTFDIHTALFLHIVYNINKQKKPRLLIVFYYTIRKLKHPINLDVSFYYLL